MDEGGADYYQKWKKGITLREKLIVLPSGHF